jgi:hypothetical protein
MRFRYIVAITAILVVGLGVRMFTLSISRAHANLEAPTNASMNVLQMHRDYPNMKNVSVQKMDDMTFIFPGD